LCEQTFVGRADMAVRWPVGVEAPVGDSRWWTIRHRTVDTHSTAVGHARTHGIGLYG
jgi:hypothetical protein